MDDDDFEPQLGRIRSAGGARQRRFLQAALAAAAAAGGLRRAGSRRGGFRGARGLAPGALLAWRGRAGRRRAIVKTRLVRLAGKGLDAARAHLRYIQRDGVSPEGEAGRLYSAGEDRVDGKAFLERCSGDRHQFRLIVSAEDGAQYDDLKPLVRRFMARMEQDLGTRLEWVAADHRDTAHPHSHVMLRGRDGHGGNLVIARSYIAHGMRECLAELVTLDLGPSTRWEIDRKLTAEIAAERLTGTDRALLRDAGDGRVVGCWHRDPFRQAMRAGRLKKLEALGLAEPLAAGRWRLSDALETELRRLGERGDIVRTLQRELSSRGIERAPGELAAGGRLRGAIVGRVAGRGLSDELADRHYLVVDGVDGRAHYVDVGPADAVGSLAGGAIVRLAPARPEVRAADLAVAAVAAAYDGHYSMALHLEHDPAATRAFAEAHMRRLEAIRRGVGGLERDEDGQWRVGPDHLARAVAYEERRARQRPVQVELLSPLALPALVKADGATWLDRELLAEAPVPLRESGFGREVKAALAARRLWLLAQGLAREEQGEMSYPPDLVDRLRRRELLRVARALAAQLGLEHRAADSGWAEGRLARRIDLASGRFALLVREADFSLVPWREGMERRMGRELAVDMRRGGASWRLARGRGPEIG